MSNEKYGTNWTEDEIILAFYYYCLIPFGKNHKGNPEIIRLASLLGRTPSSVSRKMGNLGHFDPELRKRNISGLRNASKADAYVVSRFFDNWEELTYRAKIIEAKLTDSINNDEYVLPIGADSEQNVKIRINQQFFRASVLSSYHMKCCITGIDCPALLIASHIKPWAVSNPETERTNPCNGLCLNALHDRAFDKGFLTVLPDFTVRVSSKLKESHEKEAMEWLLLCDKQHIHLPKRFIPQKEFLEYHNDVVFVP